MFKQIVEGSVKIGERVYSLRCDADSPLGELHDALMQMKGNCVQKMIDAQKSEEEMAEMQKKRDQEQEG